MQLKNRQTIYSIEDNTTFKIYNTESNLVFIGYDQGYIKNSPHGKVEYSKITKDEREKFTDIDAYL